MKKPVARRLSGSVRAAIVVLLLAPAFFLAFAVLGQSEGEASTDFKVMSFNIRMKTITDGMDYWGLRKHEAVKLIRRHDPDLIGLQEVKPSQLRDLEALLPGYSGFGVAREDGKNRGERCSIFYRTDRFELLEHDTFWLSETPTIPGSRSWNTACPRIVTWGKFRDRISGAEFYHFNTHFDHMSEEARQESARLLIEKVGAIAGSHSVVITGDFNSRDDSVAYQRMTGAFFDACKITETPLAGPLGTSWSFIPGTPPGARIDYVFVSKGVRVTGYSALDDTYGIDRRPSDHLPVLVEVVLSKE